MPTDDRQFFTAQITDVEAQIAAYQAAITALTVGGVAQYTLDTGQSSQSVTKLNLSSLNKAVDGLYNRRATLSARLNGCGVHTMRPGW
jgi:hypothetical protein